MFFLAYIPASGILLKVNIGIILYQVMFLRGLLSVITEGQSQETQQDAGTAHPEKDTNVHNVADDGGNSWTLKTDLCRKFLESI